MYLRLVYARARRMADMVASVPELTKRTFCMCGKAEMTSSARSASAGVDAPKLVPLRAAAIRASMTGGGVPEDERSPGADVVDILVAIRIPDVGALAAHDEQGFASTARKARTGELTPPGINCSARFCSLRDCSVFRAIAPPPKRITQSVSSYNIAAGLGGPQRSESQYLVTFRTGARGSGARPGSSFEFTRFS